MKILAKSKKLTLVTVALMGVAGFAACAHADESTFGANSLTVRYSDLNLDTTAGADMLYRRIQFAAKQVCGDDGVKPIAQAVSVKACVNQSVEASVHALNKPQLTRVLNDHGYEVQTNIVMASAR